MLFDLDEAIGKLLDTVKAAGIADHTYVTYTSDNGCIPCARSRQHQWAHPRLESNPLGGGVRVPFVVIGPGIKPGRVSRTPFIGYDLLPTICDLTGIKTLPPSIEGRSLKAVLLGNGTEPVKRPEDCLVFHWPHYQHEKMSTPDSTILGLNGWKPHYWWQTRQAQLFHLERDLSESHDLSTDQEREADRMKTRLLDYLAKVKAQLPIPNAPYGGAPSSVAPVQSPDAAPSEE